MYGVTDGELGHVLQHQSPEAQYQQWGVTEYNASKEDAAAQKHMFNLAAKKNPRRANNVERYEIQYFHNLMSYSAQ